MATTDHSSFINRVTEQLRRRLEERGSSYEQHGRSLEDIGPADELAQRMVEAFVPEPSRWDDLLGPFYTTGQVSKLLGGISRQAIADRRARRTLLGMRTADGVVVYPTFQFDEHHQVLSGLPEVLQCFRDTDVDDWTLAGWLVSRSRALEGESVVNWLREGRDIEPALQLARDAARRFSQ